MIAVGAILVIFGLTDLLVLAFEEYFDKTTRNLIVVTDTKRCSYCDSPILTKSSKCKFCGANL